MTSVPGCLASFRGQFTIVPILVGSLTPDKEALYGRLLAPYLAKVAPLFGSRDIFMAALLGAVLVVVSHRGHSLAAGALLFFGMFLNTIGMETVRYSMRYTFDQQWLITVIVILNQFGVDF